MKVFEIKRITCLHGDRCIDPEGHNRYQVNGHDFSRRRFEEMTGQKWEHGVRRFRLVEARSKKVGKRG